MINEQSALAFFVLPMVMLPASPAETQQLRVGENLRHEDLLLPKSTPDKNGLVLTRYGTFLDEESNIGILIFYDDVRTKREVDYVEVYSAIGDLLLVTWIDRFGISRLAMDRGLLDEEEPALDRVFVLISSGISL
jgi:hypothetical protein